MLPLLVNAGLNLAAASGVVRKLADASVLRPRDADPLDEWDIGRIVGSDRKAPTIKALRAGGWMPPKERASAPEPELSLERLKEMKAEIDERKRIAEERKQNGIRAMYQSRSKPDSTSLAQNGKKLERSGGSGMDGTSDDWIPL